MRISPTDEVQTERKMYSFLIVKEQPLFMQGSNLCVSDYASVGRSVHVSVEGYAPKCYEILDAIHGNDIHVLHKDGSRPDRYEREEVAYIFHACHEIDRASNIESLSEGEVLCVNATFVADLEVVTT